MKIRETGEEIRIKQAKERYYGHLPLFDDTPEPDDTGKRTPEQMMTAALEYINTHMGQDLGIEELSELLGISPSYFCLLFKNHVGQTFVEYLTGKRVEAARFLLENSDRSITQIGAYVGYHERRYFTRVFQKATGMTPSEYRELTGKSHITKSTIGKQVPN